ncbi:MAG: hypothetical protein P8R46_08595 [Planctomycetota bacterium]|nr:hypothetical protein [Planctomycetota bacterium]
MNTTANSAPPSIPARRLSVWTFACWALVPGGLSLYFRLQLLPGEQWGLGMLFLVFLLVWLASGLMFAFVRVTMPRPRERVAGVFLICAACGLAAFFASTTLSSILFLRGPVERAFARLDPPAQGADYLEIESDRSLTGFGRFVREDAASSTTDRAALPISDEGGPEFVLLRRRPTRMLEGCPQGVDMILAWPVRDGWWYLFTDH